MGAGQHGPEQACPSVKNLGRWLSAYLPPVQWARVGRVVAPCGAGMVAQAQAAPQEPAPQAQQVLPCPPLLGADRSRWCRSSRLGWHRPSKKVAGYLSTTSLTGELEAGSACPLGCFLQRGEALSILLILVTLLGNRGQFWDKTELVGPFA